MLIKKIKTIMPSMEIVNCIVSVLALILSLWALAKILSDL
jgi:hypothetical protein